MLGWALSLISLLRLDLHHLHWCSALLFVMLRTQLQTGLFIVAHDAMHGLLWPNRQRCNDAIGAVLLALYAALPYRRCLHNHRRHHRLPGSTLDPDFCPRRQAGVIRWYGHFMANYLTPTQLLLLPALWAALVLLLRPSTSTPAANVVLVCILPLWLSSLQLFIFGTYLPHRVQRDPSPAQHPVSLDLPQWLSLLVCFHFGYHREHHDHPHLAWFELPSARRLALASPAR